MAVEGMVMEVIDFHKLTSYPPIARLYTAVTPQKADLDAKTTRRPKIELRVLVDLSRSYQQLCINLQNQAFPTVFP